MHDSVLLDVGEHLLIKFRDRIAVAFLISSTIMKPAVSNKVTYGPESAFFEGSGLPMKRPRSS